MLQIQSPFQQLFDTNGSPLDDGYVYIGTANANPETSPIAIYWDDAGTIPAAQPLRTLNGYIVRSGTPARVYTAADDFSMTVKDRQGRVVFSVLDATSDSNLTTALASSSGSSLVGFLQAGTGAQLRTVQSKLRDVVSVKDFGAVGDGITDDTAAIQAAINFCTNLSNRRQTLYFPANNAAAFYKITAPLVVNGRLNIVGDGEFSTLIYAVGMTSGQFMIDFNNDAADVVYFGGMSQITLRSDNAQPTAIRLRNGSYWTFKNVHMYGVTTGIYITGTACFSNFFEEVTGYAISSYTVQMDNFTGGGQYMFVGCTFNGSDGFYLANTAATDSLAFYDCNFEQCITTDMYIAGSVRGLTVSGCRSEGLNGVASILLRPESGKVVQGVSITGNFWQTDSGNAYAVSIGGSTGKVKGFSITGNDAGYIGFLGFVYLNGDGESGVISGNYCENAPVVANGAPRAGVVIYANSNSSGALPEYWGNATWGVTQSSYTATATGMTTSPTGTVKYSVVGNTVTLDIPFITGTSNSTAFTLTGGPVDIRPAADKDILLPITDNGTPALGFVRVKTTGVLEFYASVGGVAFTGSGTKAVRTNSISYTLA